MSAKLEILEFLNKNKVIENDFDGSISPIQAYELQQKYPHDISFIDIRSNEERVFTGYIQNILHFTWASGTSLVRNPRFTKEVEHKIKKDSIVLLLCRSGQRSKLAAIALKSAGFEHVYNINEGFEGDLNENQQRNQVNGWKFHQLPWIQN